MYGKQTETAIAALSRLAEVWDNGRTRLSAAEIADQRGLPRAMVAKILPRIRRSAIFTYAPRTPLLTAMHAAGKFFPRSDRAPAIVPVSGNRLMRLMSEHTGASWAAGRNHRVNSTFYISEAREMVRR